MAYLIITFLNLSNNKINVRKLKEQGFFKNAEIIETPLMSLAKNEEEEHLWTLFKMRGYYALQGNFPMADKVKGFRTRIFSKQVRFPTDTHSFLANSYLQNGRFEKAIECYRQAIKYDPDDFEAYISLGDIYLSKGRYDQAIDCYLKSIQLNPDSADSYHSLGHVYNTKGDKENALK